MKKYQQILTALFATVLLSTGAVTSANANILVAPVPLEDVISPLSAGFTVTVTHTHTTFFTTATGSAYHGTLIRNARTFADTITTQNGRVRVTFGGRTGWVNVGHVHIQNNINAGW